MLDKLLYLNDFLIKEMPEFEKQSKKFDKNIEEQKILLRSLMNIRPAEPISNEFLEIQDEVLKQISAEKGIVKISDLDEICENIYLWQGDITRIDADAIVNAGNDALLGCFYPCHGCIDNAIHSYSGVQLRIECDKIMNGKREKIGSAKITPAYNLPSKYIIHTVGPIISGELTENDCKMLENCYKSSLELAISQNLKNIAFCCISTGEYHFPQDKACEIAVKTVKNIIKESEIKVIFNVFKENDYKFYSRELNL